MKNILYFLFTILLLNSAWSKDLYLTVRRDFSPTEVPQVELIYRNKAPITVRLLKPTDMKAFVAQQIDLRRSWKEPKVLINTAKYLVNGINNTRIDVDWPRNSANEELRRSVFEKFPTLSGGLMTNNRGEFSEGPPKLIQRPEQFKLVTEFIFYPDKDDKNNMFDVPGFNWWFHDSSDGIFKSKFLPLPNLAAGFYVLQVIQGMVEGQVVVVSNDIMGYMQQTDEKIIIRAADRSGKVINGAKVSVRNLNGEWIKEASTDENGEAMLDDIEDKELVVLIDKDGKGSAIIDSEFFSTKAIYPDLYLYTDRPMYKPGNEVHFKGILRKDQSGFSKLFGLKEKVGISVLDVSDNSLLSSKELAVNEFGSFSGNLIIPELTEGGIYRLEAKVLDGFHLGEFRVKDYVKPEIFAKIKGNKETLHAGEKLEAELHVERYSGGFPSNAEYKVELYRTRFTVPQFVEDAGLGETPTSQYGFDTSEQVATNIPLLVLNKGFVDVGPGGKARIELVVPMELPGLPNYNYSFLLKVTVKDSDGNFASVSKTFMDLKSEHMVQSKLSDVYVTKESKSTLTVRATYPSGKSYGKVYGKITFRLKDYDNKEEILKVQDFTTDEQGKFQLEVPCDRIGKLTASIEMKDRNGVSNSDTVEALSIGDGKVNKIAKVDDMEIYLRKTAYQSKEVSKALILLPEGWGPGGENKGKLFVTFAGKSFYDKQVIPVIGNVAWVNQTILSRFGTAVYLVIGYPHPKKGWLERKVTYRILQEDKLMKISVAPKLDTASPGTEQTISFKVKDHEGKGIKAELAVAVVDEAVLALQPEFRPKLMDFFYPMDRLNAMSFYSTQFQAYGYGELLASAFRPSQKYLTTNKITEAIKEKDTAFWNGHVVTDDNGEAKVTFRLPSNLTIWKVIVSAINNDGKFGEVVGEFNTIQKIAWHLVTPGFLRVGDDILARLMVSNNSKEKSINLAYELTAGSGLLLGDSRKGNLDLVSGKDFTQNIPVKATEVKQKSVTPMELAFLYDNENAKFGMDIKVHPGSVTLPVAVKWVDHQVSFPLESSEKVASVRMSLASGLSGTLGPSLKWLVQYPFGCIEQLVNSTMPNLAIAQIYRTLKEANMRSKIVAETRKNFTASTIMDKILKSFRSAQYLIKYEIIPPPPGIILPKEFDQALAKSMSFGESGVSKILASMNPQGDFSWFNESESGDRIMTLHVLMSLSMLRDKDLIQSINLRKIFQYVRSGIPYSAIPESIMMSYISSKLYSWGDKTVETPQSALPSLKLMGEQTLEKGSIYEMSYLLLAMKNYNYIDQGGIDKLKNDLVNRVRLSVDAVTLNKEAFNKDVWFPASFHQGSPYYRHLGRESSAVALAANALSAWGENGKDFASQISSYLLDKFNGSHFGSTYETAYTLLNSIWIFEQEAKDQMEGMPFSFKLSQKEINEKDFKVLSMPLGWEVTFDPSLFAPGENTIDVQGTDGTTRMKLNVLKDTPLEKVVPDVNRWALQKEYFLLNEETGSKTLLDLTKDHVKVGDLIYLRLSFSLNKGQLPWWSTQYTLLSSDIPASFQVIEEDRSYEADPFNLPLRKTRYATRSLNADRVYWYIDNGDNNISPGEIGLVARVANAGTFHTGVTKIMDFYDEENFSHTASSRLMVDPLP